MTCDLLPEVVAFPGGEFMMGAGADDKFALSTERPARRVAIRAGVALGRFPVTVGEYRAFAAEHAPEDDPQLPAVNVSWDEAVRYCAWLAAEAGEPYRLPTEAEWEYACRAGTAGAFATGDDIAVEKANFLYSESGERIGPGRRTPAGSYPANAFGLEDMHGNVCEWVADGWQADYQGAPCDGSARGAGSDPGLRVIRGGAWDYLPRLLRSAWRDFLPQDQRRDNVGFRIARSPDT